MWAACGPKWNCKAFARWVYAISGSCWIASSGPHSYCMRFPLPSQQASLWPAVIHPASKSLAIPCGPPAIVGSSHAAHMELQGFAAWAPVAKYSTRRWQPLWGTHCLMCKVLRQWLDNGLGSANVLGHSSLENLLLTPCHPLAYHKYYLVCSASHLPPTVLPQAAVASSC